MKANEEKIAMYCTLIGKPHWRTLAECRTCECPHTRICPDFVMLKRACERRGIKMEWNNEPDTVVWEIRDGVLVPADSVIEKKKKKQKKGKGMSKRQRRLAARKQKALTANPPSKSKEVKTVEKVERRPVHAPKLLHREARERRE